MQTSLRAGFIQPSPTIAVTTKAAELKKQGKDVIGLGAGEPDFPTPIHIKQAAIEAINKNDTLYTAVDGTSELKTAIINKLKGDNNLDYQPNQILVSTGCKQALFNFILASINPGDEVIIPSPYWVSYPDMCLFAEAKPVIVDTAADDFKLTQSSLKKAITSKTKLIILNSPSNPTGASYSKQELSDIAEVLLGYPDIMIASDDIYEKISWKSEAFSNIVNACPQLYDRTFVFNGVSKSHAMTGWRIGYVAGATEVLKGMKKIQSQSTSNPCSISQAAACAALNGPQQEVENMVKVFKKRHDFVVAELNNIAGVSCAAADGAFYAFPNFSQAMKNNGYKNDIEFTSYILDKAEVALVPGSAFGAPGFMRLSYATSDELLKTALQRIKGLLS